MGWRPTPTPRVPGELGSRGSGLTSGTVFGDRYHLLTLVGRDEAAGAELWRGWDVTLERDVAVTLLVGGAGQEAAAATATTRALRAAQFDHPARARVLDVLPPRSPGLPHGVIGAAVTDWIPGPDLAELVAVGPLRPSVALQVVQPLAAAVAAAHQAGFVLGCDHPQRVRLSAADTARMAFALPRADVCGDDDVHGLGAALYLLLTGHWALPGPPPAALPAAPRDADGGPLPVRELRPSIPVDVSALVDRALDRDSGIRTAAAVAQLLAYLLANLQDDQVLLPIAEEGAQVGVDTHTVWQPESGPAPVPDPARRRKLRIGMTLVVLATVLALGWVGIKMSSLLGGGSAAAPVVVVGPTRTPPPTHPAASGPPAAPAPPATAAPGGPVVPSSVSVYDPTGDPDNAAQVGRIIDGDASTGWHTDTYKQPFPALKPGVGVMATFGSPARISSVAINSPSPGTVIEIRAAQSPDTPLADTTLLGSGTLSASVSDIQLQPSAPTRYLLLWITKLGGGGSANVTELDEVSFEGVAV